MKRDIHTSISLVVQNDIETRRSADKDIYNKKRIKIEPFRKLINAWNFLQQKIRYFLQQNFGYKLKLGNSIPCGNSDEYCIHVGLSRTMSIYDGYNPIFICFAATFVYRNVNVSQLTGKIYLNKTDKNKYKHKV